LEQNCLNAQTRDEVMFSSLLAAASARVTKTKSNNLCMNMFEPFSSLLIMFSNPWSAKWGNIVNRIASLVTLICTLNVGSGAILYALSNKYVKKRERVSLAEIGPEREWVCVWEREREWLQADKLWCGRLCRQSMHFTGGNNRHCNKNLKTF